MLRALFSFLILIQSFFAFSQTLEYLNFMEKPILDTSKYKYEFLRITTEENGVIHTQLIDRDTVKIRHSTVLLGENRVKKGERIFGYFQNGNLEYNKRFDYEKDNFQEKQYYPSGALKSDISMQGGEVVSEIYYSESGVEITKPVIEEASPKGGLKGWNSYLAGVLRYPSEARSVKAEGTVLLAFDVDENGKIQNIKVGNPEFVHEALYKEALRVVEAYPHKWTPKKENGIPVRSEVKLPLRFKLS